MKYQLLQEGLTIQAEKRPESRAIVTGSRSLTYAELEIQSNRLAHILKDRKCRKGDRVCLLMPKCPEAIVAIFGILKADCIYVPLDPGGPVKRSAKMVKKCGATMILAAGPVEQKLDRLLRDESLKPGLSAGWIDRNRSYPSFPYRSAFMPEEIPFYPDTPPDYQVRPEDPAHILFTSGSTGEPKGVVNTHSNDLHFIDWATGYFDINSSDRLSCHPPLHFDMSSMDIYSSIFTGAELHMVPSKFNVYPKFIAEFIRNRRLTQWFSVPSVLTLLANTDEVGQSDFPDLRRMIWCGEVLPTATLIYLMKRLPHADFTNLYGPTETTIASSYYTVEKCPEEETEEIPIGRPCKGEELYVLDEKMRPVASGETGHLYISGRGVSRGYWNDPGKTKQAFFPNPFSDNPEDLIYKTGDLAENGPDRLFRFRGREDRQIKHRGYRIELGEIENALHNLQLALECAVVAIPDELFGHKIGCAWVSADGKMVDERSLRQKLSELMPSYMVPTLWQEYVSLPRNKNGKIDRNQIKTTFENYENKTTANQ